MKINTLNIISKIMTEKINNLEKEVILYGNEYYINNLITDKDGNPKTFEIELIDDKVIERLDDCVENVSTYVYKTIEKFKDAIALGYRYPLPDNMSVESNLKRFHKKCKEYFEIKKAFEDFNNQNW